MAFTRVVDWKLGCAECVKQGLEAGDQGLETVQGVGLGGEVAARGKEIGLHVDYEEGGGGRGEGGVVGEGVGG